MLSPQPADRYDPDVLRPKGTPFGAELYIHDGVNVRRVDTGDEVHVGDRIGFRLDVREGGHVMIVGVDTKGSVYVCHPQDGSNMSREHGGSPEPITIDEAMRFDAVPGLERLLVILCPTQFELGDFEQSLAVAGRTLRPAEPTPQLMQGCAQRESMLRKVPDVMRRVRGAGGAL